jgi:hypothetical protein
MGPLTGRANNSKAVQVSMGIISTYFSENLLDERTLNVLETNNIGSLRGTCLGAGFSASSGTDSAKYRMRPQIVSCTSFGAPARGVKEGLRDGAICGRSSIGSCALVLPNALHREF